MKLNDKIKLAVKSLLNNKTRSILTVIIVFVVSTLITSLMLMSINFITNTSDVQIEYLNSTNSYISINKGYKIGDRYEYTPLSISEISNILDVAAKNDNICTEIEMSVYRHFIFDNQNKQLNGMMINYNNTIDTSVKINSFNFPLNINNAIIDGRIWNKDDVRTNNIWITDTFLQNLSTEGNIFEIGDSIWLHTIFYDEHNDRTITLSYEYIIQGIMSKKIISDYFKDNNKYYNPSDIYIDFSYFLYNYPKFEITHLQINFYPPKTDLDFNEIYKLTDKMAKELYNQIEIPHKDYNVNVFSSIIETLQAVRVMSIIIIAASIILTLFILALSIGSIANTIIISVDNNKKHLGLMKALGLKQKDVEGIVKIEAIINILVGIFLSTILILFCMPLFKKLMEEIVGGLFTYELLSIKYQTYMFFPIYLPIAISFFFLLLAFIFSRSSLRDISRMDSIAIISEVS